MSEKSRAEAELEARLKRMPKLRSAEEWTDYILGQLMNFARDPQSGILDRTHIIEAALRAYVAQKITPFLAVARAAEQLEQHLYSPTVSQYATALQAALAQPEVQERMKEHA